MESKQNFIKKLNEIIGFNIIYWIIILAILFLLIFAVIVPLLRLSLGSFKNFFLREKKVCEKFYFPYDDKTKSTATGQFNLIKSEKKKIKYLRTLQSGNVVQLGGNDYIVVINTSSAIPIKLKVRLKKILFHWDKLEFTIYMKAFNE